jgi:hypothetical protein
VTTKSPWREQSSPGNPPTEDRATPGTVIGGRYELIAAIGHGGMGTVWRATDTLLHREVAVKEVILPPTMPQHEKDALCERTMREARAAAAISHPSVVQVYDVVTDANRPWIVMELLQARSLADMVIDDGPLPPRAVAKIGIAMLGALEVAHAAGVLHRDVKPANVLICDDGRCVLTDFGVARLPSESKLTTPGMVLGSPHFISPERAVGGEFGPPSDLFSLGVTLYTAVEGGPPFDRGDPFETMRAVVEEPPRPPRLAGPLKPVLMGLLEKEPERRWTVEQARTALRELLAGPLAPARKPAPRPAESGSEGRSATEGATATRRGAVGGRAMLDPNEPLDQQVARLREAAGLPPDPPDRLTDEDITRPIPVDGVGSTSGKGDKRSRPLADAGPRDVWWDSPSRALRPSWAGGDSWGGAPARSEGPRHSAGRGSRGRPGESTIRREHVGRRRAPSRTSQVAAKIAKELRNLRREILAPRNRPRVIVGAGLATVLLAIVVAAWSGAFGGDPTPPTGPRIETQEFRERGIALNIPAGWERTDTDASADYHDPTSTRWIRITIEPTDTTAMLLLQGAQVRLQDPEVCPPPFAPLRLVEASLAGLVGAELEYICGEGDTARHGIWRAVVRDGVAYHLFLTTDDADFAASRVIYEEMVHSFQFL